MVQQLNKNVCRDIIVCAGDTVVSFLSKGACICSSHCSGSLIEERISFPPSAKRLGANRCEELAVRAKLTMKVAQF